MQPLLVLCRVTTVCCVFVNGGIGVLWWVILLGVPSRWSQQWAEAGNETAPFASKPMALAASLQWTSLCVFLGTLRFISQCLDSFGAKTPAAATHRTPTR